MYILGIESSCDETSAAVVSMDEGKREILSNIVKDGRTVLSNCITSQIEMHTVYGGVVPEIASRAHIEAISGITYEALEKANLKISFISVCIIKHAFNNL